jgi:hypothetical protein
VKYLVATKPKDPWFVKVLVLAQLLGWMVLDQRPGQRWNKDPENDSAVHGPRVSVRYAHEVGNYVLAQLLRRQRGLKKQDETTMALKELLEARGGVGGYVWMRGSLDLYNDAQKAERELHYVYLILSYLCRCKKYELDASKFNIETAKEFLAKRAPERKPYKVSRIEKIWLRYKNAAPYIFAFYGFLRELRREVVSPRLILNSLQKIASDERRLKKLIGRAAYAADVLSGLARDVRMTDFKDIARATPPLRPFSPLEKAVIDNVDRNAPIP